MTALPDLAKLKTHLLHGVQRELAMHTPPEGEYQQTIVRLIGEAYTQTRLNLPERPRDSLLKEVYDELVGYGPLQALLADQETSEIMVVGAKKVYIEKHGELIETGVTFDDDNHVLRIIDRMVLPLGRRVDADSPAVDARLPDGSRVHVVIPPVSVDGPCITIRKFLESKMTVEDLIAYGSITPGMVEFLRACVAARLNIVVSGGTSSGKTTMLNALSGFIPLKERIITIEDAVELKLQQKHVVRLETKNPTVDGTGAMLTRDLVRHALRMRPDRIVVGEARGGEAMDMLQAMNTGHDGSITTLHANSPRDAISRMETMCMMAGLDIPLLAIRKQIAAAIDLIVHMDRLEDGTRKTAQITEVAGMESDVVTLNDIFKFDQTGLGADGKILGEMKPTGIRPLFTPRLEVVGFKLAGEIFGAATRTFDTERRSGRR
jgi:pilus assembly protein CpaF